MNLNGEYLSLHELEALSFARRGIGIHIHRSVIMINCERISLSDNVRIDAFSILSAGKAIQIGRNVHVGSHCVLTGKETIELGDFSGLSHGVKIYASSDDYSGGAMTNPTVPDPYRTVQHGAVRIGRHAIVGSGTVILPNAEVGEGCAVGALSLVNRALEPWTICSGIPAKCRRRRKKKLLDLEAAWLNNEENSMLD